MPKYIDVENLNLKGIAVFDENLDVLIPLSDVRKAIQMTPTADVAPRAEVAREIFEEIYKLKHTVWDWTDVVEWDAIAELKKRYTEDNG